MRETFLKGASLTAIITTMLATSAVVTGQWDERYWSRLSKTQVERVINNVEIGSDQFRKDFDRWLDNSHLDGSEREDKYNSKVKNFENAADRLRSQFDRNGRWWETRDQVESLLNSARPVASMMRDRRFSRGQVEFEWRKLRKALNKLADTYRLRPIA